jgi:hypothetical protein
VFDALTVAGAIVLGGDLWKMDGAGFALCYENWFNKPGNKADASKRRHEF